MDATRRRINCIKTNRQKSLQRHYNRVHGTALWFQGFGRCVYRVMREAYSQNKPHPPRARGLITDVYIVEWATTAQICARRLSFQPDDMDPQAQSGRHTEHVHTTDQLGYWISPIGRFALAIPDVQPEAAQLAVRCIFIECGLP